MCGHMLISCEVFNRLCEVTAKVADYCVYVLRFGIHEELRCSIDDSVKGKPRRREILELLTIVRAQPTVLSYKAAAAVIP